MGSELTCVAGQLVPDRVAFFASMARVLRPGGVASVLFPTLDFTPDLAKAQADRLPVLSGAALQLWSGKVPQCDPKTVMQEAAAAGLVRGVCTQTGVDGVVAVTAWAA